MKLCKSTVSNVTYSMRDKNIFSFHPEFFKLMNEVENEDLVFTLETIVDKFGEEMAPYALGLCQNLVIISFIFI
jgi:hypothetical protein